MGEHDTKGICLNLVGLEDRGASQFTSSVSNAQCMNVKSTGLFCFSLICHFRKLQVWNGIHYIWNSEYRGATP